MSPASSLPEASVATLAASPAQAATGLLAPEAPGGLVPRLQKLAASFASGPVSVAPLSPRAVDLVIPTAAPAELVEGQLRALLGEAGAPVDVIVQPLRGRRKQLFLADMDSTMIGQECIDELADFVGLKEQVSAITERAMRGELAFEPALRERVSLLRDLELAVVDRIIAERLTLNPGARELVMTMRANGAHTCLVSGGFTVFTGPVSEKIGFHEHHSNVLEVVDGKLTGRVSGPVLGREAKLATLVRLREQLGLPPEAVMAVGDGANDLDMLLEAGLGVAYYAKPAVAAAARARIEHTDLTTLLFAQGYREEEFVR
ncbi:phosphoserine phosphatase SerB [Camelimonas abortus]|uniref:Phosphoserine phosphatase n=1 Tax=Camelimonas abortus TaxID=1017184 RepID=A0ABV7LFW2_9HYPH